MNNYQIAPSQLQVYSATESPFGKWQSIDLKLPLNCSAEQASERLLNLSGVLELLCTRLTKIESLSVPVQQVSDAPDVDTLQINTAITSDTNDLEKTIAKQQAAINNGQAIVTLATYDKDGSLHARLMTHRSHFDSKSIQLLAGLIIEMPSDYEIAQFLDFSEWLNEGFSESSQAQLAFWYDRQNLASPELGNGSTEKPEVCKTTLSLPFDGKGN